MKELKKVLLASIAGIALVSCGSAPKAENKEEEKAPEAPAAVEEKAAATVTADENSVVMDLPDTPMLILDNFEDGNYWYGVGDTWDQWGSHNLSLTADLSTDWGTDGETSLLCKMEPATASSSKQATWCCNSPIETDLSAYNYCAVDVYNPNDVQFNLSIAIQNGDDWAWDQTDPVLIGKGVHTLVFDLTKFSREHLANVFCFMIQHAEIETEGTYLYFDNFRMFE